MLLPLDTPEAVPWTSRQLCNVSGLPWEIVVSTVVELHCGKFIKRTGGSRGRGYLWVRTCESLPPDRRGHHGQQPNGTDHWRRRQRRAASAPKLRQKSNGHLPVVTGQGSTPSLLDSWPRLQLPPDDKK